MHRLCQWCIQKPENSPGYCNSSQPSWDIPNPCQPDDLLSITEEASGEMFQLYFVRKYNPLHLTKSYPIYAFF